MSVIAAALRELMAAGLTGEDLVRAVARIEAETAPANPSSFGTLQIMKDMIAQKSLEREKATNPGAPRGASHER